MVCGIRRFGTIFDKVQIWYLTLLERQGFVGPEWYHEAESRRSYPHHITVDIELQINETVIFSQLPHHKPQRDLPARPSTRTELWQLRRNVPNKYAGDSDWRIANIDLVV